MFGCHAIFRGFYAKIFKTRENIVDCNSNSYYGIHALICDEDSIDTD